MFSILVEWNDKDRSIIDTIRRDADFFEGETFMESFFAFLNVYLWGWPMLILLVGTHIYMTFRTGFYSKESWFGDQIIRHQR